MWAWLRRIMGRTGKPAHPDAAPPMAMDKPPPDLDPLAELKRLIGAAEPPGVPRRPDGSRRKGPTRR
jgi:hypothetical protein